MTVPRSLMKHAARMALPKSVVLNLSSSMTAYTTATEVVGEGHTGQPTGARAPMKNVAGDGSAAEKWAEKADHAHHAGFFPFGAEDDRIELGASEKREHDSACAGEKGNPFGSCAEAGAADPRADDQLRDRANHDFA